jgi:ribosomal protein S18 acetylase RimI-like enzyme
MPLVCLHDRATIEGVLRRNAPLHLYALGDLDDFFWPYTTWYAFEEKGRVEEVALMYTGTALPTLLALSAEPEGAMRRLLSALAPALPRRFYGHLSGDLPALFAGDYLVESHGLHYKMVLNNTRFMEQVDTASVINLLPADRQRLEMLYAASYPGNWFDPRMLESGHYYGIEVDGRLVCAAGIHAYSPVYRVAALGNLATHPDFRGRGFATAVCARLCLMLSKSVDHIGLNVKASNSSAANAYRRWGFAKVAEYEEALFSSEMNINQPFRAPAIKPRKK